MIVGIDLAGSEKRATGFCVLDEKMRAKTCLLFSDEDIVKKVLEAKPRVIAIDAPLALPKGRKSIEKKSKIHLRECDKQLLKMGIRFFPITLGPMRSLTKRGMKLRKILEEKGFKVIETYPGGAQDLWGIARKQAGIAKLRKGLEKLGVKMEGELNGDELDAVTCALVGKLYLDGNYLALGDEREILLILPKPKK